MAINVFDWALLTVTNATGTDPYSWREPFPNSEACTRILGINYIYFKEVVLSHLEFTKCWQVDAGGH